MDGALTESAAYEAGTWAVSRAAAATPARAICMTLRRDSCACTFKRQDKHHDQAMSAKRQSNADWCRAAPGRSLHEAGWHILSKAKGGDKECVAVRLRLYAHASMPGAALVLAIKAVSLCGHAHAVASCAKCLPGRVTCRVLSTPLRCPPVEARSRTSGRAAAQTVSLLRAGRGAADRLAILGVETKVEVMLAILADASGLFNSRCRGCWVKRSG